MSETTDSTQNNDTTTTTEVKYTICPCCGKATLPSPAKPNEQLMDHWLACIVTGTPFTHTYNVYDGKLAITVSQLTPDMAKIVNNIETIINIAQKKPDANTITSELSSIISTAKTVITIMDIEMTTKNNHKLYHPNEVVTNVSDILTKIKYDLSINDSIEPYKETLLNCYKTITSKDLISGVPAQIIFSVLQTHNNLSTILMDSGFDSNFWKGIELA